MSNPHVKPAEGKQKDGDKNATSEKKGETGDSGFTKEEDAKIIQMKTDGKTWAEIAKEIGGGRHKDDISRRFKELNAKDGADKSEVKDGDGGKEKDVTGKEKDVQPNQAKMSKKEKKAAKAQHDREEGLKKQGQQQKKQEAEGKTADGGSKNSATENTDAKVTSEISSCARSWLTCAG